MLKIMNVPNGAKMT